MKNIIVLYHDDQDGFGGAWAAWKKFKDRASYLAVENGNPPKNLKNKEIYFIDFCYRKEELEKIIKGNKKVVVIDHHASRKNYIKISTEYLFDADHSAAFLAWNYFFPKKLIPKLLLYIEDMDLWKWKMPHSREIANYIESHDFTFKIFDKIVAELENKEKIKKCLLEGQAIERYKKSLLNEIMNYAEEVQFEGQKAFAVNSPVLDSEVGNFIYDKKGGIGIIWRYKNKQIRVSLRSNRVNVAELAKKYGGGGHKQSSGFRIKADIKFPWKESKKHS